MINYTSREKICFLGKNSFVVEVTFKLCIKLISNQDQDQPIWYSTPIKPLCSYNDFAIVNSDTRNLGVYPIALTSMQNF